MMAPRDILRRRWIVWMGVVFGILVAGVYLATWVPYPVEDLRRGLGDSYRITDREGRLLREVVNEHGARAKWVDKLSTHFVAATLAAEDRAFFAHSGLDWSALGRALWQNTRAGRVVSGASTLTMQVVRMHRGYKQRSLVSKALQIVDAWRLERSVSKQEILVQYVNRATYGAGTVGIEAASHRYFGKPHLHLSLAEAALLAGLTKSPSMLNPLRSFQAAKRRQRYVLNQLRAHGDIDDDAFALARQETLSLIQKPPALSAGHFTDYVLAQNPGRRSMTTTLDLEVQRPIERLTRTHVESLERGGLTNAAVVVLDHRTCEVLAMTGSTGYWDDDGAVNGALALRQPGSTLKPFLFALAFERGFDPGSVLSDIPTVYHGGNGGLLRPQNYSEKFSGPVLAKDALGRSLNVPSIRLANVVGIEDVLTRLREAGLSSLTQTADHYGLGLVLGNGEVRLLELTRAYAALARGGMTCALRTTIDDAGAAGGGSRFKAAVEKNQIVVGPEDRRLFSKAATFMVTDALSDTALRVRAFGINNPLTFDYPVALKTGTSSNWRDSWVVGYTDRYTVGVWSGDFSGRPMNALSGSLGAGPLFHSVVDLLVKRGAIPHRPVVARPPEGLVRNHVCALSGLRPTAHCPHRRQVWTSQDDTRSECTWHRPAKIDRRNGLLASDKCPARFVETVRFDHLPVRFAPWQAEHPHATRPPPRAYSPLCPRDGLVADALVITHPQPDDVFIIEPGYRRATQTVNLEAEVDPPVTQVVWHIDGERYAQAKWPYEASWPLKRGRHTLRVSAGDRFSDPIEIEVR